MTLREKLREAMSDCPACIPDDCDGISDADVPDWAASHGITDEGLGAEEATVLRAAYTANGKAYLAG
jgi:hypothetical protein